MATPIQNFRLDPALKANFTARATQEGLTMTRFIRLCIMAYRDGVISARELERIYGGAS